MIGLILRCDLQDYWRVETIDDLLIAHSFDEACFSWVHTRLRGQHDSCLLDDERILELMIFLGLLSPLLADATSYHWLATS